MKYKFICAYQILGATRHADSHEEVLVVYPSHHARAILTYDVAKYLFEIDRASSIARYLLNAIVGKTEGLTFEEGIKRELAKLTTNYRTSNKDGVFVVFEAEDTVESWDTSKRAAVDDFEVVFNAVDKAPIYEKYKPLIHGILSSFALGCDNVYELKKLNEGVYFIEDKDKPIYSFSFKGSGVMGSVSTPVTADQICYVKNNAKILGEHRELVNTTRLLIQSLDKNSDTVLAFLAAWNGLEILVQKIFKTYETNMFDRIAVDKNISFKSVGRIRNVMKDKYRLVDKFSIIASELIPDEADDDIEELKNLKCAYRDKLLHGQEISLGSLPTERVRNLLKKYLNLHLERLR